MFLSHRQCHFTFLCWLWFYMTRIYLTPHFLYCSRKIRATPQHQATLRLGSTRHSQALLKGPIRPPNRSIRAPNRPIRPPNQPIRPPNQPIRPPSRPIRPPHRPIRPLSRPIRPIRRRNRLIRPPSTATLKLRRQLLATLATRSRRPNTRSRSPSIRSSRPTINNTPPSNPITPPSSRCPRRTRYEIKTFRWSSWRSTFDFSSSLLRPLVYVTTLTSQYVALNRPLCGCRTWRQ